MAEAAAAALKPGEVRIDVGALSGDSFQAGEALKGLFADDEDAQEIRQEAGDAAPPAETGQEETPATGDTETGQSEQEETSAIEPPVSWTAEAKQRFAQLPPELQTYVAERESERERLIATQGQKASEETRRLEAERTALANERAQQTQLMQGVLLQLTPELQRFQQIDWDKLAAEKPAEWAQQWQAFSSLQARWNMATQQIGRIQEQQRVEAETKHNEFLKGEYQKLTEKVPELADRTKLKAFQDDLVKYLPEYTPQELAGIADHRILLAARDAMLFRKDRALREQAKAKLKPNAAAPVRQLKPVARQGGAAEAAKQKEIAALHETMRKSGGTTQSVADLLAGTGMFDDR